MAMINDRFEFADKIIHSFVINESDMLRLSLRILFLKNIVFRTPYEDCAMNYMKSA